MRCTRSAAFLASALALATGASAARAQDDGELPASLTSDRPGVASSAAIAARLRLTTELGAAVEIDEPVRASLPNLSLRAGVFEWLELRARVPGAVGAFAAGGPAGDVGAQLGVADPFVGFKIGGLLTESVSASSVWEVSIPIGTDGERALEATWRADLQVEWRFWGPLALTPNALAVVLVEQSGPGEARRYFEGGGSLKLAWQIIDVLGLFVQGYVVASERRDVRVLVGGGLVWRLAPNIQIDASFEMAATSETLRALSCTAGAACSDAPTVAIGASVLW